MGVMQPWPFAFGVLVHHGLFIRGEWHMQAPAVVILHAVAFLTLQYWLSLHTTHNSELLEKLHLNANTSAFSASFNYLAGLFGSITIYRVFLHRLRDFDGPRLARFTNLWQAWQCRKSKNYQLLDRLYRQYGEFVRIGPSTVAVFHPEGHDATDGPSSKCTKAVWYDFLLPFESVVSTRNAASHNERRKVWDQGFNSKSLATYEPGLLHYVDLLDRHLETSASTDQAVNITDLIYFFSFDCMGHFALGKDFAMLENGYWHKVILMKRRAFTLLGPFTPILWLARIGFAFIPMLWVVRDWFQMMRFCHERMDERMKVKSEQPDVANWLIKDAVKKGLRPVDRKWLNGDGVSVIIAGSDTTASVMVSLLYHLAIDAEEQEKLYAEISSLDVRDAKALQNLAHLNATINEAMRLHPAVPTGVARLTPPEGIGIAGRHIPGDTTVLVPRYTLGRLESCFEQAESFIPERWYSKKEMVRDKRAFAPFGLGRTSCVGKTLAMIEMRFVIAHFVQKYHFSLGPGETGKSVEADMVDQFTSTPGDLNLQFTRRQASGI